MHAQRGGPDARPADAPTSPAALDPAEPSPRYPRVTSFRSRRSALSDGQHRLWERRWPEIGREAKTEGPGGTGEAPERIDTAEWFGREAPLILEIGCGTGTSTLAMAKDEPELDVIAVEVYKRGLAQLLSALDRDGVTNVRLIRGDAIDVLEHLVAPQSLTAVRVFFPDPWPKARHHKRRLLQSATVALIANRLRPGGVLHAATDVADYAEQIAEVGDSEQLLRRVSADDTLPVSVLRPITKYENKAGDAGRPVTELIWVRR